MLPAAPKLKKASLLTSSQTRSERARLCPPLAPTRTAWGLLTGRVRLVYAPGAFDDEPKSGEVLGWVDAADLRVYDQRNCQ